MGKPDRIERRGEWMQSYHGGTWHLAVFHETYYQVSERVFSTYHTAACNGASLYSAWGKPTVKAVPPGDAKVCKRCAALAARAAPRAVSPAPKQSVCGLCGGVDGHAGGCQRAVDEFQVAVAVLHDKEPV